MAATRTPETGRNGPLLRSEMEEEQEGPVNRKKGTQLKRAFFCFLILSAVLFIACVILLAVLLFSLFKPNNVCLKPDCIETASSVLSSIDFAVDPCSDFYQYACGKWIDTHHIPDDSGSVSNFENIGKSLEYALKTLLDGPPNPKDGEAVQKAKLFYHMCDNESEISTHWGKVFGDVLEGLGGWPALSNAPNRTVWKPDALTFEQLYGRLVSDFDLDSVFKFLVQPDDKNSSVIVVLLDQPALNLPGRDSYLSDKYHIQQREYRKLMVDVLKYLGADLNQSIHDANDIVRFETQLVNVTTPEDERMDIAALYTKISLGELQRRFPNIQWIDLLKTIYRNIPYNSTGERFSPETEIVLYGTKFLEGLNEIWPQFEKRTKVNYILWSWFFKQVLPELPDPLAFRFYRYNRDAGYINLPRLRWHGCITTTNKLLKWATSFLYIRDRFDPKDKDRVNMMIDMIRDAFDNLLEHEEWLTPETKAVALRKMWATTRKVAYPSLVTKSSMVDELYKDFTIYKNDYLRSKFDIIKLEQRRKMRQLDHPVNRSEWSSGSTVVNAFYSPNTNEIIIPAGILQPLFWSPKFPWSMKFGGIGVVIGHEITHGFDDRGRLYDKFGNIRQWWDNGTIERFEDKARCVEDQYSGYVLNQINQTINGKRTNGENIADNGGLAQAYTAYQQYVRDNGEELPLPGVNLTHNQLFFVNYAQIWCGSMNDKEAERKLAIAVHSPGPIRVKGPLSNSRAFAEVFQCPEGSPMNPKEKCKVW